MHTTRRAHTYIQRISTRMRHSVLPCQQFGYHPARGAVVAFTGGNYTGWETWDWETITHLGFWTKPNDAQRDLAKAHGVRLFIDGGLPDKSDWTDASARQKFGAQMAQKVQDKKVDGVFFDYEGNGLSKEQKAGYGLLAEAVTAALVPLNATIFVCVGGRPEYELRDYPYAVLANHSEFLFIMGYDMHFWDDYTCVAKGACSPAEAPLEAPEASREVPHQAGASECYSTTWRPAEGVARPRDASACGASTY